MPKFSTSAKVSLSKRGRGERKETLSSSGTDAGQGLQVGKQVNYGKIAQLLCPGGKGIRGGIWGSDGTWNGGGSLV